MSAQILQARLLSPHVGPIRTLRELPVPSDHAALPAFIAETADLRQIHQCAVRKVSGSALHYTRPAAMAAALGEAVERYCGAAVPDGLPLASARDLGVSAVAPERFSLFHAEQYARPSFPYRPFTSSTVVRWTEGVDLTTGAAAHLPAQLVYLGADALGPDASGRDGERWGEERAETPIGYATSSGMACAASAGEAILAGLLELVERDAVMLTWYLRRSPPRLQWRDDPQLAAVEERYFASSGLRYLCLDLSDGLEIATALAVVFGTEVGLACGAAAAATGEDAWLKAMREAFATYAWASRLHRQTPPILRTELHRVRTFADHVRFYAHSEHVDPASFLWSSEEERAIRDLPRIEEPEAAGRIAAVCGRMRAAGASAFAVDLTTDDIRRVGLHVWKAVSPELQPLDVGYDRRCLGGSRLAAAIDRCTVPDRSAGRFDVRGPGSIEALNPWPHPFP